MAADLGELVTMHHTLTRHRGWLAAALLAAGALLSLPTWVLWLISASAGVDPLKFLGVVPAALGGAAIGMLGGAVTFGIWALRHRGEVFEVHHHGLRVIRAGRTRDHGWAEITGVEPQQIVRDTAFTRWTGGDYRCFVRLADGGKYVVTGLTYSARELVARIEDAAQGTR